MNIKRLIPNLFTMLNLFCGCVALVFASIFNFEMAFYLVCLGIFFDFFDGFFARKFGVAGPLGVQLDSLADMVTSGVVPGYVMFQMLLKLQDRVVTIDGCDPNFWHGFNYYLVVPYLGFIITLGACYRLAKFNIDTRQSESFIGLPTPANSLFFTSLPFVGLSLLNNQIFLIALTLLSAYVMNAELPLFSLKIKDFGFEKYRLQIFFLLLSAILIILLHIAALPVIILTYVLLSVINNNIVK